MLLAAIGLPISIVLGARRVSASAGHACADLGLLEAPGAGLAILTVGASFVLATGGAVGAPWVVVSFWGFVAAAWALMVWHLRRRGFRLASLRPRIGRMGYWELGGLVLVVGLYLSPFLSDNQLEFWHYAGTDGYYYMRIAEYFGNFGTANPPTVGLYDAASGLVSDEARKFNAQIFLDKPGTMASLALLSRLLGLLRTRHSRR